MSPPDASAEGRTADTTRRLAASVRDACAAAFLDAYEEAGMLGLCAEGRLEAAVGAVRSLDPDVLVRAAGVGAGDGRGQGRSR